MTSKQSLKKIAGLFASVLLAKASFAAPLGVYDAQGVMLGTFVSTDATSVQLVTGKGYVASILVERESAGSPPVGTVTGALDSARAWQSLDCSGPPLTASLVSARLLQVPDLPGSPLYYVPTNAASIVIQAGQTYSRYTYINGTDHVCQPDTMLQDTKFLPAYPNDPAVTGINATVALPLKVAFINAIFIDGFDSLG